MQQEYTPTQWFWIVAGDDSRWWSSAAGQYVDPQPDWGSPTRVASEQELNDVLAPYGLIGPYQHLQTYAANKRWAIETGGITINGVSIGTRRDGDRNDQAMITGAVTYLNNNPDATEVKFKADSGWVTLDRATMLAIGVAVGQHVQTCFAAEEAIGGDIASGVITTTEQIDTDSRWP